MMDTGGSIKRAFWLVDGRISSLLAYEYVLACCSNVIAW